MLGYARKIKMSVVVAMAWLGSAQPYYNWLVCQGQALDLVVARPTSSTFFYSIFFFGFLTLLGFYNNYLELKLSMNNLLCV